MSSDRVPVILLVIVGLTSFVSLILMAFFNQLIADDVAYFQFMDDAGIGGFLHWHYFEHTGRIVQSLSVAGGYWLFGDWSVKIMPALALVAFCVSLYLALTRVNIWRRPSRTLNVLAAATLGPVLLLLMPSTYDSYLWWTSSSLYLVSITALVLNLYIADRLTRDKLSIPQQSGLLLLVVLGQTLSEITSIVLIGGAALALSYAVYKKHKRAARAFTKVFLALVAGFLLTYFSSGSVRRRASEDGASIGFDFVNMFVLSIKHFFEMIAAMSTWELATIVVLGAAFGRLVKTVSGKTAITVACVVLLAFIVGVYGSFVINNYVWVGMSWRTFTLPAFLWATGLVIIATLIFNRLYQSPRIMKVLPAGLVLVVFVALVGLCTRACANVSFMKSRETAYLNRAESIQTTLAESEKPPKSLEVQSLPILMVSDATDFVYGVDKQVDWYEQAFKARYGIPRSTEISVARPPAGYCYNNICDKTQDSTTMKTILRMVKYWVDI